MEAKREEKESSLDKFKPKFFINKKENIVNESLRSLVIQHQNILFYEDANILLDKEQLLQEKVRLICGGGSGHEPAHGSFVGEGMLAAAVCGEIYSSPTYVSIKKTIDLVYSPKGVIILIKNYGGDIINFTLAKELACAEGKKVEMLIVDDDISLSNLNYIPQTSEEKSSFNKRRGLCGIVYLYKILGSMCQEGCSFEEILETGKNIIPTLFTLGVSLSSSITPFSTEQELVNNIKYSECEIGLGIHGEKGKERIPYSTTNKLIEYCFVHVFEENLKKEFFDTSKLENNKKELNLIVNNLGSCSDIEMNIILSSVVNYFKKNYSSRFNLVKIFVGKFMTSLNVKGFSITLVDLDASEYITKNKQEMLRHLDSKNNINIFNAINFNDNMENSSDSYLHRIISYNANQEDKKIYKNKNSKIKLLLDALCKYLISQCEYLNNLDKEIADGDLGIGVERGCSAVLQNLNNFDFEKNLKNSFKEIGNLIASHYGGTSGPLIASFLIRGSQSLLEEENFNSYENWVSFFSEGTKIMQSLGKADINDKTMMDVLIPINELLIEYKLNLLKNNLPLSINDLGKIICVKLEELIEKIKMMRSHKGRSSYQEGKEIGKHDPGSIMISMIIKFIFDFSQI